MSAAYVLERASRTINELTLGWGNLRERLPVAWDNDFGTIGRGEIDAISPDLGAEFAAIKARLQAIKNEVFGWAAASIAEMTDSDVAAIAREIVDLHTRIENAVEYGQT